MRRGKQFGAVLWYNRGMEEIFEIQNLYTFEGFVESGFQRRLIYACTSEGVDPQPIRWEFPITINTAKGTLHGFFAELDEENGRPIYDFATDEMKGEWRTVSINTDLLEV